MNIIDKVHAAVASQPFEQEKSEAREKARAVAGKSGWLALILDHHVQIEACFADVKDANSAAARRRAQKQLGLVLTGHAIAEESVIYPAMALHGLKADAAEMYEEQSNAKVQMAALEALEPMSPSYLDKLEQIRTAVAHHVCEEEGKHFLALKDNADTVLQSKMSRRYKEEYERYVQEATKIQRSDF